MLCAIRCVWFAASELYSWSWNFTTQQTPTLWWISTDFQFSFRVLLHHTLCSVHFCECRCGVCGSYPPLPPERVSAVHECQEECAVWEAVGHERQRGAGDPGLFQDERRLPHGGMVGADQKLKPSILITALIPLFRLFTKSFWVGDDWVHSWMAALHTLCSE